MLIVPVVFHVAHSPSHPGSSRPSYAGVVASLDDNLACFHTNVSAQSSRQEVLDGLEDKVKEAVRAFHQKRKFAPRRVIFLRDGARNTLVFVSSPNASASCVYSTRFFGVHVGSGI